MPHATRLDDRSLIRVSGEDAFSFLQALVTNDIAPARKEGGMVYACLLTPQGRFLHDFFITRAGAGGFYLECERARREDLIRRLGIFRLRAKVRIEDCAEGFGVYAASGGEGFRDPRLPALGVRFYAQETGAVAGPGVLYKDRRIALGVPEGSAEIYPEEDTLAHVNLDQLNAIGWDKGCYVGQEVTNMTKTRGTSKRRMVIVTGQALQIGEILQEGQIAGVLRAVNSAGTQGLAVIKLAALEAALTLNGKPVSAQLPDWVRL